MKFLAAVFLCAFAAIPATSQTQNDESAQNESISLTLAKADKDGNIIEDVGIFKPTDIPITCYVGLGSLRRVSVKVIFVAVKAVGIRPNSKIITVDYTTKDDENSVSFTGQPEKHWAVGLYRVDLLIDGSPGGSKEFRVEK